MEVICINDSFHPESIAIIPNRPVKGKIYSFRKVFRIPDGRTAVWLNEVTNPDQPMETFSIVAMGEPSFNIDRFSTLNGDPQTKEKISELIKTPTHVQT